MGHGGLEVISSQGREGSPEVLRIDTLGVAPVQLVDSCQNLEAGAFELADVVGLEKSIPVKLSPFAERCPVVVRERQMVEAADGLVVMPVVVAVIDDVRAQATAHKHAPHLCEQELEVGSAEVFESAHRHTDI